MINVDSIVATVATHDIIIMMTCPHIFMRCPHIIMRCPHTSRVLTHEIMISAQNWNIIHDR